MLPKKYEALVNLQTACGVKLAAGRVFTAREVNQGSIDAMLRLGQCVAFDETKAPAGFTASGPSEEDMRGAVSEIDRLRKRLAERDDELAAAEVNLDLAKSVIEDLKQKQQLAAQEQLKLQQQLTAESQRLTDDGNPHPEPPKAVEAEAKAPKLGPSKPPELKAAKK